MIALPVQPDAEEGNVFLWEQRLRKALVSLIQLSREPEDGTLKALQSDLANPAISLNNLSYKYAENPSSTTQQLQQEETLPPSEKKGNSLLLTLQGPAGPLQFTVHQPEFIIGKNGTQADGAMPFAPTVSRIHCKILQKPDGFVIEDLGSKNHTWVNGVQLIPGTQIMLRDGDMLQVAEYNFHVKIF